MQIYVYRFYEAQATLLRRRKRVTIFGHTDYCRKGTNYKRGVWEADRVFKET